MSEKLQPRKPAGILETILRKFSVHLTLQSLRNVGALVDKCLTFLLPASAGETLRRSRWKEIMTIIQKKKPLQAISLGNGVQNRNSPFQQVSAPEPQVKVGKWLAGAALIIVLGGFWYYNHRGWR